MFICFGVIEWFSFFKFWRGLCLELSFKIDSWGLRLCGSIKTLFDSVTTKDINGEKIKNTKTEQWLFVWERDSNVIIYITIRSDWSWSSIILLSSDSSAKMIKSNCNIRMVFFHTKVCTHLKAIISLTGNIEVKIMFICFGAIEWFSLF